MDKSSNMLKQSLYIFFCFLFISIKLSAQTLSPFVISATGGSSSGSELSWTIGETFTETYTGSNYILTQGFQQPELLLNMGAVPNNLCANAHFAIPYTVSGIISITNVFVAVLSDKYGNFGNPSVIGSKTSTISGTINAIIPTSIASGSQYRIRIISTSPVFVSNDNGSGIAINSTPCFLYTYKIAGDSVTTSKETAKTITSINNTKFTVTVMPNPSTTNFRINVQSNNSDPVNIRITDVTGRIVEVISKQVFKMANVTSTFGDNYRAGTYFAEVIQGNNNKTITLIKL